MKSKRHIENLVRELDMDIDPHVDERMLDSTLKRFKESTQNLPAAARSMNRRTIMKNPLAKLAIAATVIVAILLGFSLFDSTANTTWANVLETVTGFETYVFRTRKVETAGPRPDGFEFAKEGGSKRHYSETYGSFTENYQDNGKLFTRMYTLPKKKESLVICYPLETYSRHALTETQIREFHENPVKQPKQIIKKILAADYTELGQDVIEGKPVRGVETRNLKAFFDDRAPPFDDFAVRLWIDVETELPVWVEMSAVRTGSPTRHTTIMDQFEWGVPLAAAMFEPEIPTDFEPEKPTTFYTDSAPKTDAAEAFAANTQAEPYLGDFDHLVPPNVRRITLLGVNVDAAQAELRLRNHEEVWQAQDASLADWPRYEDVDDRLAGQLQARLSIEQMTVEELVGLGIALRERFWELRGCLSDSAYPYGYAARHVTKMAHAKAPDDPAVTDQYVESIMTAEVGAAYKKDDQSKILNPVYPGLLTDLRTRQFEQLKGRVSQGYVPKWKDYVRTHDLIILLNSYGKDYAGALAVTQWLIAQADSAGWTYYLNKGLGSMEKAFAAGEGYRSGLFMYGPDAFPEENRYARRLFSFQGPAKRRPHLLPIHMRHLKGW
ncbi:MAG: hypothetical protein HQ515_05195 [Phycisphaeraceae bacterium]|nr:hypothetical protein [Phycisphaeraceae bacterium]